MIVMFWLILIPLILFIPAFIDGLTGVPRFARYYGVKIETEAEESEELHDINKQERISILDSTLVQYNKLLENLAAQYNSETDPKKRGAILRQQITTLEKYNRALEKREKLGD